MLKRITNDQKDETTAVADLQAAIKAVNPDLGEKVSELQRLDKVFGEPNHSGWTRGEIVTGKLPKQ